MRGNRCVSREGAAPDRAPLGAIIRDLQSGDAPDAMPHRAAFGPPMKRNRMRRWVFYLAVGGFAGSAVVAGVFLWAALTLGIGHVASASLFASSVFLACCAGVLYAMSLPPRAPDAE